MYLQCCSNNEETSLKLEEGAITGLLEETLLVTLSEARLVKQGLRSRWLKTGDSASATKTVFPSVQLSSGL